METKRSLSQVEEEIARLEKKTIGGNEKVQEFLERHNSTLLKSGSTLAELVKNFWKNRKNVSKKQIFANFFEKFYQFNVIKYFMEI